MSYFSRFPFVAFTVDGGTTYNVVSDVLRRIAVKEETKENYSLYEEYIVQDGETPETVSHKFYNDTQYHWVVMMLNDIIDPRFDWPLSDTQLYDYVNNKYSGNINGIKHYTISEDNDIVIDSTQVTTKVFAYNHWNFPSNIATLYQMAFQGGNISGFSEAEKAVINLLQQPSDDNLPGSGVLYRGDIDHNFRSLSNGASFSDVITASDALKELGIELALKRSDPNSIGVANKANETYNEHVAYNIIRPMVETGNSTGLLRYLSVSSYSPSANGIIGFYSNSTHSFSLAYNKGLGTNILEVASNITPSSGNVDIHNLLKEVAQTKYLNGDVTRSTFHGAVNTANTDTDINVLINFRNRTLDESSSLYANANVLLNIMISNATIRPLILDSSDKITVVEYENTFPNAYGVTNLEYESKLNEQKRTIKVLRPKYLTSFLAEFEALVNG